MITGSVNAYFIFTSRDELERLEDQKAPKTVIAIVGATGEGKSSLINALLDHRNVLPTSGMRACTSVVVEVVENTGSDLFEADIEFRSKEVMYSFIYTYYKVRLCEYTVFTFSSFRDALFFSERQMWDFINFFILVHN